jgi:hypothetical protein
MTIGSNKVVTRPAENLNRLCGQQVSITFGNEEKQYFCFCWGVCRDRFFMTQIPADSDIQGKLAVGAQAIVRFVESGMVCGFKTHVNKALTHPFKLIFFDYPKSIDAVNLRHSKRVPIFLNATIQWKGEDYEGAIRDLSEGGCFFEMNYWQDEAFDDMEVGSTFPIRFTIHGDEAETELEGKAVRVVRDQDDLRLGIAFTAGRQKATSKIANFISYISKLLEHE